MGKLSPEEKQWLSNFNEEWLSGNTNHPGKKLHKTKQELREIYGNNNARNRDLFNHQKAKNALTDESQIRERDDTVSVEDVLIEAIDSKDEASSESSE